MKYLISIVENLTKTFVVDGDNYAEAKSKIESGYELGDITLDYRDYSGSEIIFDGIASEADEKTFEAWED